MESLLEMGKTKEKQIVKIRKRDFLCTLNFVMSIRHPSGDLK